MFSAPLISQAQVSIENISADVFLLPERTKSPSPHVAGLPSTRAQRRSLGPQTSASELIVAGEPCLHYQRDNSRGLLCI